MRLTDDISSVKQSLINHACKNGIPVNGSIELLPLCNMSCDMCYVHISKAEMLQQGKLRSAKEWLDIARQMQRSGVLFLLLTGGEPLLYPEFKELYLELKKLGMFISINTNGTLLDAEWADFFSQHKPTRINITLYGADELAYDNLCHFPGGFEKALNAIKLLKERNIDVCIGGSITIANEKDVNGLISISQSLDVPIKIETYIMPAARAKNTENSLKTRLSPESAAAARINIKKCTNVDCFDQYVENTLNDIAASNAHNNSADMNCLAGRCSFTINWQGNMRSCVVMSEPSADVFELGFERAWQQIHAECQAIELNSTCNNCELRAICKTCPACAKLETGSYDGIPEYMCRYTKESYRLIRAEEERITYEKNISNR